MKNWDEKDEVGQCLSDSDMEDAKFVCQHIGIPFQEVNFVKDYWNEVFRYLNYSFIYTDNCIFITLKKFCTCSLDICSVKILISKNSLDMSIL